MEHVNAHPVGSRRIPMIVWVALAIAITGAGAVLVFGVAVDKALTYGFFGFMILAHLFMHAGHGSHSHGGATTSDDRTGDGSEEHRSRGGCH